MLISQKGLCSTKSIATYCSYTASLGMDISKSFFFILLSPRYCDIILSDISQHSSPCFPST